MLMKSQRILAIAAATAFGAGLAGSAFAQGGVPGVDVDVSANLSMSRFDKDADKKISKSEASSDKELNKQFTKLDANKDGNLDEAEFAKFEAKGSTKGKMGNKDGAPGKDEGDPANTNNRPGTTDDSTPGNEDKLGPGR